MQNLEEVFFRQFNTPCAVCASAPGRLEILGNHTDYNEGIVLSCAVTQRTAAAMGFRDDRKAVIYDCRADETAVFDLDKLENTLQPKWANYPAGVVSELAKRNMFCRGFNAVITSNVPLSAGMSSSAAFETSVLFALAMLHDWQIAPADAARIGQGVENCFLGVQTGLLDQFSSIFGEKDKFILSDFRTVEVLDSAAMSSEAAILVVNSMEKHNLVDSEYNVRRAACESAAAKLAARHASVKTLRDVSLELLESEKSIFTDIEYRRARHVVEECFRVRQAMTLLRNDQLEEFGKLWWDSHESSQKNFENSTPALDKLVEFSHQIPGGLGARLSGGGFGGISIHLVRKEFLNEYQAEIAARFAAYCGKTPEMIVSAPGAGATAEKR